MTEPVPLSAQQEAFLEWMQARSELRHPVPVCVALRIRDRFDARLFERALRQVALRHEALRMVFPVTHGRRRARVLEASPPEVRHLVADSAREPASARDLACRERERPFDLENGPLARATVIELAPDDRVLLLAVHHLISDGWSMEVMVRELAIIYSSLVAGGARTRISSEPMQCSEVIHLSRQLAARRLRQGHGNAWSAALAGAPASLRDFKGRTPARQFSPRSLPFTIQPELASTMRGVARAHHATTFMVALTAWSAVLSRWSGADHMVVMSPVGGRAIPGSETAIGCLFFNALITVDTSGSPAFSELLRRVRSSTIAATSQPDRAYGEHSADFARPPYLSYYGSRVPLHFPGLESEPFPLPPQLAQLVDDVDVPLLRLSDDQVNGISAELIFNQEAFDETTIAQLAGDFVSRLPDGQTVALT
jgi:condensation domain-containing protein